MGPHPLLTFVVLVKLRLCLGVACAAALGYLLLPGAQAAPLGLVFLSVLSLACGAGCLNNVQDRNLDRLFARTRNRPIPSGRVSPLPALLLSVILIAAGVSGLFLGPFPRASGWAAVVSLLCYNTIYTPMKRRSLLALAPGIVCGSIPPLIGWLAGGGTLWNPFIWSVMISFGLWQPPHFWLVVLKHHGDYRQGVLPSMLSIFSRSQVVRILFVWVVALAMSTLALPLTGGTFSPFLALAVAADAALLTGLFAHQLFARPAGPSYRLLFACLNLAVFLAVALLALHRRLGT